jgi:hypothetical protein
LAAVMAFKVHGVLPMVAEPLRVPAHEVSRDA